eukprot:4037684-Prymnesium_polylepis.2
MAHLWEPRREYGRLGGRRDGRREAHALVEALELLLVELQRRLRRLPHPRDLHAARRDARRVAVGHRAVARLRLRRELCQCRLQ